MRRSLLVALATVGLAATGCLGSGSEQATAPVVQHAKPAAKPAATKAPAKAKPSALQLLRAAQVRTAAEGSATVTVDILAIGKPRTTKGVDSSLVGRLAGVLDFAHHRAHLDTYAGSPRQPQLPLGRVMVASDGQVYVGGPDALYGGGAWASAPVRADAGPLSMLQAVSVAEAATLRNVGQRTVPGLGKVTVLRSQVSTGKALTALGAGSSVAGVVAGRVGVNDVYLDGAGRIVGGEETLDVSGVSLSGTLAGAKQIALQLRFGSFGVHAYQHAPKATTAG